MKRVVVELEYSSLHVHGSTYHIRHILKMLRFRYDRQGREWVWRGHNPGDVDVKEEELSRELRRCGCYPAGSGYDYFGTMTLRIVYLCPFR